MKFLKRLLGVLRLNEEAFFNLTLDRRASLQAFFVVIGAAIVGGLRWIVSEKIGWTILVGLLVGALAGWWLYARVIGFVGQFFFGTDFSRPELLRLIGFAMATLAFVSLPYIGWLSIVWYLAAVYRGLRSVYSANRLNTVILVFAGFSTSFVAWGVVILIVTTVLSGHG